MRIVVSGTHSSGKSTLISDFALARPEFVVLDDPYELIDEPDAAGAASFVKQLQLASDRLIELSPGDSVIAERGPLDFLAYLIALDELGRGGTGDIVRELAAVAERAMRGVDLLVLLPPASTVDDEEDPVLRTAMADALIELIDDVDLVGPARVIELTGAPDQRLHQLLEQVTPH